MISKALSAKTILEICGIFILFIWVIPLRFWPLDLWPSPNEFKINRYSNQTEGITPILYLEELNVLEKARGINSEDNEYFNLSYQGDGLNRSLIPRLLLLAIKAAHS
ncbi:MAG: hypothetical protein ACFFDT_04340 [Candidatus Hodarchaeota archaeon]